jgi:uncharacterized protein YyaL (SSP411 family)
MADSHKHTNRLINETSPYLLQHAHNPVDWYPWGEDALKKAQQEDKPILLSIGYSACHWCHVMERESFENVEIASFMNAHFVPVKVDREERPDLDSIYMQAVQAITHQGGWPMTMFLTPDGRPFYGGTYFPPRDRQYGSQVMPGFPHVMQNIIQVYEQQRETVEEQANQLADYLKQHSETPIRGRGTITVETPLDLLATASRELRADFDAVHGGFRGAPKFPNTMALEVLLRVHLHRLKGELPPEQEAKYSELEVVETSLQRMANGGIYDQLGGGFHRYSVDDEWLVPHFEKMLYDNALLSRIYLHTYLITNNPLYSRIVEETLSYVMLEMTSSEGGFYSTQDADSEGEEGKFFVWTVEEVKHLLPPEIAPHFMQYYDVTPQGNFEDKNILHVVQDAHIVADDAQISLDELQDRLKLGRKILFQDREQRIKPGRDEKILTSWNGLMLRSFAEAGRYLNRPDYVQVAINNANFLLTALRKDGRLLRTYKDGRAHLNGYLEDYAFLADGLLALYEATFDPRWFNEARALIDQAITLFADEQNGGFFDTGTDHETLITRPKDIMDNATPAGNSVAIDVLVRLAAFTGETTYRERADEYLQPLASLMAEHPQSFGHALGALDFAVSPAQEFAIVGDPQASDTHTLLNTVNSHYQPNSVLASCAPGDTQATQSIALLADRPQKEKRATIYVCQNFACLAPINEARELEQLL